MKIYGQKILALIGLVIALNLLRTLGLNEKKLTIEGKPIYIYQNGTLCIHKIGGILLKNRGKCPKLEEGKYRLIGSVNMGLLDRVMGWIWIDLEPKNIVLTQKIDKENEPNFKLMQKLQNSAAQLWSEANTGLVMAMIFGKKEGLRVDFSTQMKNAGLSHIAVASGFNVMLVAGPIMAGCLWLWRRKWATVIALMGVWSYVYLIGGGYSVIRAGLMVSIYLGGLSLGRKVPGWYLLSMIAILMWAIDPGCFWSISWQLSMAATSGLILLSGPIEKWLAKATLPWGIFGLAETLGASLMTLPIVWWHFGKVSYLFVLSNSLIVPMVSWLTILGAVSVILQLTLGLGVLPALVVEMMLWYLRLVLSWYN